MNTYNPKLLMVQINGVLVTGWAKGDFFSITPKGPANSSKEGAVGDVSVSVLSNTLFDVKVVLLHGSPVAAVLKSMFGTMGASPTPIMPFVASDPLEPVTYTGECWFTTPAGTTWGEEGKDHEWAWEARLTMS